MSNSEASISGSEPEEEFYPERKYDRRFLSIEGRVNWAILFFYGAYILYYIIGLTYRLFLPEITLRFVIAEYSEWVDFKMSLAEIFDIVLIGIIFSINAYTTYNLLLGKAKKGHRIPGRFMFIIGLLIMNFGNMAHLVANQMHNYIEKVDQSIIDSDPNLNNLELGLYFWDEIASHILIAAGYFLLILNYLYIESKNREINFALESRFVKTVSFFTGVGLSLGFIEGQSCFIFIFVVIIVMFIAAVKARRKPFHYATVLMCIGYLVFTAIYVLITGPKDIYPYIKQITELGFKF